MEKKETKIKQKDKKHKVASVLRSISHLWTAIIRGDNTMIIPVFLTATPRFREVKYIDLNQNDAANTW